MTSANREQAGETAPRRSSSRWAKTRRILRAKALSFSRDDSGQIAILFGLASTAILFAAGSGIDLSRAYQARQKLSEVATLACQYASRPAIAQTASQNGGATYSSSVNTYITNALSAQQFGWTQTNATPFAFTQNGPADVSLSANVPTAFMQVAGVVQMPVSATSHCFDTVPSSSPYVIQEGFEASACSGTCFNYYTIPGQSQATPSTSFSQTPTYTGSNGTSWYGMGYCLETDSAGIISASVPEGSHSAELDCDNGSHTAGNSSISAKSYLSSGSYELRYWYRSRVSYPNYDPAYLCGSAASDLSWANDINSSGGPVANALRTNQVNVYLDPNTSGSPPMHATIDGTQQLAGSNLIDMCVYSAAWIERSVKITVTSAGDHWLTFAADGQNDSYGAQIDNIRLCPGACPGTLNDNFPAAWLAANNGGVNKLLFEDRFESPVYSASSCGSSPCNKGDMNQSTGASGAASSGWPSQAASGWATAPYNQMDIQLSASAEGTQSIELDATVIGSMTTSNRLISRPFLLDPGYYNVQYYYRSNVTANGISGIYCGATPTAAGLNALPPGYDTDVVGVFMSNGQLTSTPIGGGALNSQTSYKNPNGTTSTTPTVAPDALSLSNYNAAQPNPLVDLCGYSVSWTLRSANVFIQKPGYYWLTFSSQGTTADGAGGAIDDVKLTALGSPYMAVPPSNPVTIPAPNPQPSAQVTYSSFKIVADPVAP